MSDSEDELEISESDGDEEGYSSSDLEMNDDFSDHSFSSDTDSDPEPDTCSSINTYSQASSVGDDGDFWSDDLHDVDLEVTDFVEETGPRHNLPPTANVLMYFFLMFSEEFFSKLTTETNKYSSQQRQQVPDGNWVDTTIPEMMAFIGLQILMGIVQMPSIEMYWSKNIFIGNAGFQNTMPRNRFQALQRYFHVNDNEARIPQGEPEYDRLHKIRPLIDMVRKNFKEHYLPGQHQAIDEGMIKYKGRFYAKQYMPGKPVKRGLKVWMRCEKSGYCGDFLPYLGKHDQFQGRDLGERVVRHLCRPLKHKGHCVYFDRFFTSLRLVRTLEFSGIYSCGTIKHTSLDVPEELRNPSRLQRGDVMQKQHGNLVLTAWKDKKLVHVLSSGCDPLGDDPVVRRLPGGGALELTRPPTVTSYQKYMSGVDRCMQHRAKYPVGRPCKKYWKYLMNFILEVCLINAYQIWKETPGTQARKKSYKLLDFRTDVSMALIGHFQRFQKPHQVPQQRPGTMHIESRLLRKRSTCKWCTRQGEKRRKETVYGCKICDLHLCEGDCFVSYHRQKNLPIPN